MYFLLGNEWCTCAKSEVVRRCILRYLAFTGTIKPKRIVQIARTKYITRHSKDGFKRSKRIRDKMKIAKIALHRQL